MKLERLISIIYKLLNHEVLSASTLAEEFGVSQRTIYRDMDTIGAAGFPIVSHQGSQGGYGMIDGYKLDKSLLGSYDVASLITVLHSLSTMFDDTRVQGTIERLQSIEQVWQLPRLDINFQSYHTNVELLQLLRQAIAELRVVHFEYVSAHHARTVRDLEPIRMYFKYGAWYVYGYCRVRQDYREFRLSRMLNTVQQEQHFTMRYPVVIQSIQPGRERPSVIHIKEDSPPPSATPDTVQPDSSEASLTREEVIIRIHSEALADGLDQFQQAEQQFHDDGSMTVRLLLHNPGQARWLRGTLLSFGSGAEVLHPPELRSLMRQQIRQMLGYYEDSE